MIMGCTNVHPMNQPSECDGSAIAFDGGMNAIDAGTPDAGAPPPRLDNGDVSLYREQWGVNAPIAQLVSEVYTHPSGWTELASRLATTNRGYLVPLQEQYVTRFETLEDFTSATVAGFDVLGGSISTIRMPLMWPLWHTYPGWTDRITETIRAMQIAGWKVRPELTHNESYPVELQGSNPEQSGWAHREATYSFLAFVQSSVDKLKTVLPPLTPIYLAVEPIAVLWNGYLDDDGKWPPGGTRLGTGLHRALLNLRDALVAAAHIVRSAGFRTALAVNILPVFTRSATPDDRAVQLTTYLRSWWLSDQLIFGACQNLEHAFAPDCIRHPPAGLDILGITFYGSATPRAEHVRLNDHSNISLLSLHLQPDAPLLQGVLADAIDRYRHSPATSIEVAEFGFSDADIDQKLVHLIAYKRAMQCNNVRHATMHTLFLGTAEFSAYDWTFGLIRECGTDYACSLTPWGARVIREIAYPPSPNPCIE